MKEDVLSLKAGAVAGHIAPLGSVLAYGALGLPLAMAALPLYVHVPRLYAETTGMSLALLGGLLLAARLADAVVDPLLGVWSDRTRHRQSLILLALPILALGMVALLQPANDAGVLWLLTTLLISCTGFSLASIAYQAWGAQIAQSAHERTRLTASREGFGLLGVVLAAALPAVFSQNIGEGMAALAWAFVPLLGVLGVVTLLGAPDPNVMPTRQRHRRSIGKALGAVLANPRFRRLLTVFVVNGVASALPATLVLFFVADVLQAERWSGGFLALYFVSGVIFLPLWVKLARRWGRVGAWVLSMLVAVLAFSWAFTLGANDVVAFAVICLLSGAALGADLTLPSALLADFAEAGKVDQAAGEADENRAGACFGLWNFASKLNLALAAGIALPLLGLFGFEPGADAVGNTIALSAIYGLLPLVFKVAAASLAWRWRHSLEDIT